MKVLFAPDYREGNPYQALLAGALRDLGLNVVFATGRRRVLPFARAVWQHAPDLVHLHWPEAYFPDSGDGLGRWRKLRWPLDLALGVRGRPLVVTAHNLFPHAHTPTALLKRILGYTYRRADGIIAHSAKAAAEVRRQWSVDEGRLTVIPHGDLAVSLPPLPEASAARAKLGLKADKICVLVGTLDPYKGIEEVVGWWKRHAVPASLHLVGKPASAEYAQELARAIGGSGNITLHAGWLDPDGLACWLAAADAALFNYRQCLTSGAACLARSLGLPVILPERLDTIDLGEPHPTVFRFKDWETDFPTQLARALAWERSPHVAAGWRASTAWAKIGASTVAAYRLALQRRGARTHALTSS